MSKDIVWHELYDAMTGGACPVCVLVDKSTRQMMDAFFYENVNDLKLRQSISEGHGFCNYHAFMLRDMGNPLAHALIYTGLLEQYSAVLGSVSELEKKCLFCNFAAEHEETYCRAFIDFYRSSEFRERYLSGGSLCVSHVRQVVSYNKYNRNSDIIPVIIKDTAEKYRDLINDLNEIKRKHDYRYVDEKWTDSERTAWKRAVSMINGLSFSK